MIGQFFAVYNLRLYCRTDFHRTSCAILIILVYWSHYAKFVILRLGFWPEKIRSTISEAWYIDRVSVENPQAREEKEDAKFMLENGIVSKSYDIFKYQFLINISVYRYYTFRFVLIQNIDTLCSLALFRTSQLCVRVHSPLDAWAVPARRQ